MNKCKFIPAKIDGQSAYTYKQHTPAMSFANSHPKEVHNSHIT